MQQLIRLPLPFGQRSPGALDVRPRLAVCAIEEEDARPDIDGEVVAAGEVVVQPGQQQLFDSGLAIPIGMIRTGGPIGA